MIAAVCIEDRGGMLFHHRRVSRDKVQQEDLLTLCGGNKLWLAPASAALFGTASDAVVADEAFLEKAGTGEICFVEDRPLLPVQERLEKLVVYRWNRRYPSDFRLDLKLEEWNLIEKKEFPGNSHDTITREIYERRD